MEKASKKDFLIVTFCFLILTIVFAVLYLRNDGFNLNERELELEEKIEGLFRYTPVKQSEVGEMCPESFVDERDGQEYSVVQIGEQCWMAENLNYEEEGVECYENRDVYGCYYNWELANKVCPEGWKLGSDDDWKTLEIQLGMSLEEAHKISSFRYTLVENGEVGGMLKSQDLWEEPNECYGECNSSGFNALPAGSLEADGPFYVGERASFWTASEYEEVDGTAVERSIYSSGAGILRDRLAKDLFYSVRCLME